MESLVFHPENNNDDNGESVIINDLTPSNIVELNTAPVTKSED